MRIKDYPYGKPTQTLTKAVKWLNRNKKSLSVKYRGATMAFAFDYPDYLGMPKLISSRLSPDQVDWLQETLYDDLYDKNSKP